MPAPTSSPARRWVQVVRGHGYLKARSRPTDPWTFFGVAQERLRRLRRPFQRAQEAVDYARAVAQRLRRLRALAAHQAGDFAGQAAQEAP